MNTITLDLTGEGMEHFARKQEGDPCDLASCSFTVLKNDGSTLVGELTEIEPGGEYQPDSAEETQEDEPKEKPVAVIALGIPKKK